MLRLGLLLLSVFASLAWAADAPNPGGKGRYTQSYQCLETGNRLVSQVCADLTFHYALSAFMGEPLAHYGLEWRLRNLSVAGGKSFSAQEARDLFGGSVDRIELMVQGLAEVRGQGNAVHAALSSDPRRHLASSQPYLVVDVDSGVATRAGKVSWNIAGSPDWGKFMMLPMGGECAGPGGSHGGTDTRLREFVEGATAKAVMKSGNLQLSGRALCKKGTLVGELESLESAIQTFCQTKRGPKGFVNTPYTWCPDKPAPATQLTELLDAAASQPQIDAKLKELQARHLEKVESQCKVEWARVNSCYASQGCAPRSKEDIAACQSKKCGNRPAETVCNEPLSCKRNDERRSGALCFPNYCNGSMVPNALFPEWSRCAERALECQANDTCIARCNPEKYASPADCVAKSRHKGGPTQAEARSLVEQVQKTRPGQRDPAKPTSFLD